MVDVYATNPWQFPWLADYPLWPFMDLDFWYLGNILHEVAVREVDFPAGVSFHNGSDEQIRARDAFLCSGLLMSPARYGGSTRTWGFFLEHVESLSPVSGRLRLVSEAQRWDERTRTVFVERFALGLAGWLLWQAYDVLHIADAGPFIARALGDPASPYRGKGLQSLGLYGKNGGFKPDLFCLTRTGEAVVAESKGALGPPSKLTANKRKGKEQVRNVTPVGVNVRAEGGRLVFATNIRRADENPRTDTDSCVTIVDPDAVPETMEIHAAPNEIVLHSYSKVLTMCGLPQVARALMFGASNDRSALRLPEPVVIDGLRVLPLLLTPHQVIGLEARVAHSLFSNSSDLEREIRRSLLEAEIGAIQSSERTLVLPNGVVYAARTL